MGCVAFSGKMKRGDLFIFTFIFLKGGIITKSDS